MCRIVFTWIVEIFLLIISLLVKDVISLRDVLLTIEPKVVQRSTQSTLRCSYDLEGDDLYSVKWYRGRYEFYRYTPSERPSTKIFAVGGINVDNKTSASTHVVIQDIDFNLSGNFSCEVTTDAPISTGIDTKPMLVVQLPEYPPTISVGREPLDYGDILRANCSSPPSRPPATLSFLLNNVTFVRSLPLTVRQFQETAWSDLSLETELTEFHFIGGRVQLRCIAEVADIYHEEAVLMLTSRHYPVPERVSAYDMASDISPTRELLLIIYIINILFLFS